MPTKISKPADPAIDAAKRFFEADGELSAIREDRKAVFPHELTYEGNQCALRAYWRRRCAESDLASRKPKTLTGVIAALEVVTARLQGLEASLIDADRSDIPSIVAQARKALQALDAERRKAERQANTARQAAGRTAPLPAQFGALAH